ncbi:MAG: winged helix-turn-helix transcriptional regulator [Solirubrobacterales bacterium]
MARQYEEPERSPLGVALTQVGDRWSLLIVDALLGGPRRFQELAELVEGISASILSQRLKHLEAEGLVVAMPYSRRPPRFAYELTAPGGELAGALRLLAQWGAARGEGDDSLRHETCGTPAEARWWCPTCARLVEGEVSELHHL